MPQSLTPGANDEPGRHGVEDRGGSKAGHRAAATTSLFFQMKIVLYLTKWYMLWSCPARNARLSSICSSLSIMKTQRICYAPSGAPPHISAGEFKKSFVCFECMAVAIKCLFLNVEVSYVWCILPASLPYCPSLEFTSGHAGQWVWCNGESSVEHCFYTVEELARKSR